MKQILKALIRYTPLYPILYRRRSEQVYRSWEQSGRPVPPPHIVKQKIIKREQQKYGSRIMVETGTYYGEMVDAVKNTFEKIYTIELSPELHERAQKKFRRQSKIEVIQGDSGKQLAKILPLLNAPTLFWLDGHYSTEETARGETDTPILQELETLLTAPSLDWIILVDDARCFGLFPAYPTQDELKAHVHTFAPQAHIHTEDDVIIITQGR